MQLYATAGSSCIIAILTVFWVLIKTAQYFVIQQSQLYSATKSYKEIAFLTTRVNSPVIGGNDHSPRTHKEKI